MFQKDNGDNEDNEWQPLARLPATEEKQNPRIPGRSSLIDPQLIQVDKGQRGWKDLAFCSSPSARKFLAHSLAQKFCVLPLAVLDEPRGKILTVIFAEPLSAHTVQEVKVVVGVDIIYETAKKEVLEKAIFAAYAGGEETLLRAVERISQESHDEIKTNHALRSFETDAVSDSAIPSLLTSILSRGISLGASDIHLEPKHGSPSGDEYRIRFRIDGLLHEDDSFRLTSIVAAKLSRRVKVLARLDITNGRLLQEGAFTFTSPEWSVRLRISFLPQVNGEKIVVRLLGNDHFDLSFLKDAPFAHLGLTGEQEQCLRTYLGLTSGTILLSGPTGSGKSTLLYAAIQYLNTKWRNIVTIEDPVERLISGVNQAQVCREAGLDYDQWLSPLLRQDPDVIMVGEIRNRQMADAVFTAGITGHLVLSTLHAGNCLEVLSRLFHFPISIDLLFTSLRLIISQRLLPKNCQHCLRYTTANRIVQKLFHFEDGQEVSVARGCKRCFFSGVMGRIGVFEFLAITDSFRKHLSVARRNEGDVVGGRDDFELDQLAFAAAQVGYHSYAYRVRELLLKGVVSPLRALQALGVNPELGEN